ncbi:hypothetical protein [Rhizobium sp. LjRoot254]|uniref:hypothetical protein n=1 Tax=Rhizobium sp. LjRoot254 TaxID=3342297 RepID=UPI003ED023E6
MKREYPDDNLPARFAAVRRVYDAIVASTWFYDTEETRSDCYEMIFAQFRKGVTNPDELMKECLETARERFAAR